MSPASDVRQPLRSTLPINWAEWIALLWSGGLRGVIAIQDKTDRQGVLPLTFVLVAGILVATLAFGLDGVFASSIALCFGLSTRLMAIRSVSRLRQAGDHFDAIHELSKFLCRLLQKSLRRALVREAEVAKTLRLINLLAFARVFIFANRLPHVALAPRLLPKP